MKKNIRKTMNKQITIIGLLLTSYCTQSMDIAPFRKRVDPQEFHDQYVKPAHKFLLSIDGRKLNDIYRDFEELQGPSQLLVSQRLLTTNCPLAIFTTPKDMFIAVIQTVVPQYEIKQKVKFNDSQYAQYKNGYPEHKPFVVFVPPLIAAQQKKTHATEIVATYLTQQKFFELNALEALNALSAYANPRIIIITDLVEDPSFSKSSLGDDNFGHYFEDKDLHKSYKLSFDDCIHTTSEQRKKLYEIADGHKKGLNDKFDKRYILTEEDIDLLLPIIDIIDSNDLFRHLQIGVAYEQPTTGAKFKDVLLLAAPLSLATTIIPVMIHNNINGKLQGSLGGIASYVSGFITGNFIFPKFDAWNSSALTVHKNFGPDNKTTVEKRWSFAGLSLFHYVMHALATKLLSLHSISYQSLGYTLHGLRVLSAAANMIDIRAYLGNCRGLLPALARGFHLKRYNHPLERRNKDDKSYTLIDALKEAQRKRNT